MPVTRTVAALVGIVVLGITGVAARGDITVQSWSLTVMARAGGGGGAEDTLTAVYPVLPPAGWQSMHYVSHTGESSESIAESRYDFSVAGDDGSFSFDFEHLRGQPHQSQSQSDGDLFFTGDAGLIYSLEGAYTLYDYQSISLSVVLEDLTTGSNVFDYDEAAFSMSGSMTLSFNDPGTLVGGHEYRLHYDYWINASADPDEGAYAEGSLEMNLTPIPAPGAALLGVIGLGTVGCARRRIA